VKTRVATRIIFCSMTLIKWNEVDSELNQYCSSDETQIQIICHGKSLFQQYKKETGKGWRERRGFICCSPSVHSKVGCNESDDISNFSTNARDASLLFVIYHG
jgi:hypothetical protein